MHALVVFESMFGNTAAIARAVGSGLATKLETEVHEVGVAPRVLAESTELLVVGGPTHAFGMSREGTRVPPCVRPVIASFRKALGSGNGSMRFSSLVGVFPERLSIPVSTVPGFPARRRTQ